MRKSVIFAQTQSYFGADSFVHSLLMRGLPELGFQVSVAVDPGPETRPTDAYSQLAEIPDIELVPARFGVSRSDFRRSKGRKALPSLVGASLALGALHRHIRKNDVAVVHATEKPRDVLLASMMAARARTRSLIHLHVKCHDNLSRITTVGLKHADAIVGVSEFVRGSVVEKGYQESRTHAIMNAIDVDAWEPEQGARESVLSEFGFPEDAVVLMIAARIFRWKGHSLLLDAMAHVIPCMPNARLLVVGEDDPRGDGFGDSFSNVLRAQVTRLGLANHVVFTGHRRDMRRLHGACDVFVMPSFEEPFGLVYAEAMAMQRPVVGLNSGGTREVVEHGVTGLLSDPEDSYGLASNILRLASSATLRSEMGMAGRRRVERLFGIERLCADFAELYESLSTESG